MAEIDAIQELIEKLINDVKILQEDIVKIKQELDEKETKDIRRRGLKGLGPG